MLAAILNRHDTAPSGCVSPPASSTTPASSKPANTPPTDSPSDDWGAAVMRSLDDTDSGATVVDPYGDPAGGPADTDHGGGLPHSGLPPPSLCQACKSGNPVYWLDIYGGGPHCAYCLPPPVEAMVRQRLLVVGDPSHADPSHADPGHGGHPLAWADLDCELRRMEAWRASGRQ